jgi:glutamate N-acetyltransferase/amino-acid N-acetyltransferase
VLFISSPLGRIVSIDPKLVNLHFSDGAGAHSLHLFKDGAPYDVNEDIASKILEKEDVNIIISLGLGDASADMYTCDFSHEYISINADYRS